MDLYHRLIAQLDSIERRLAELNSEVAAVNPPSLDEWGIATLAALHEELDAITSQLDDE